MYIGPWQEFKLAKILQIKDRVEKEQEEGNRLEDQANLPKNLKGHPQKAYSMNNRPQPFKSDYFERESSKYSGVAMSGPVLPHQIPSRGNDS